MGGGAGVLKSLRSGVGKGRLGSRFMFIWGDLKVMYNDFFRKGKVIISGGLRFLGSAEHVNVRT